MKTSIFYSAWASYLASRLPCPLSSYSFTKEHIAPKSLFPISDARNVIPLPEKLNHARGNRPYTADWQDGRMVYSCKSCPHPGFCRGAGVLSSKGLCPPDPFKGPIARSVLYQMTKYPHLAEKLDKEVLDWKTAIQWDSDFPMTLAERMWLDSF